MGYDRPASSRASPPRGGVRQQMADVEVAAADAKRRRKSKDGSDKDAPKSPDPAPFRRSMRADWAKGLLTSRQVLEYAAGYTAGGGVGIGKLGSHGGVSAKHAHEKVVSAMGWPPNAPQLSWLDAPTTSGTQSLPFICPIEALEGMQKSEPTKFEKTILGSDEDRQAFWEGMKGNEVYKVIQPKPDRHTLGFGIHGDAAPTHKTDGLFTISWNSVHGTGSTMETRYIYAVVKNLTSQTARWRCTGTGERGL